MCGNGLKEGVWRMSEISRRLLALIGKRGLTYDDLSQQTGLPKATIQRYATGETAKIPADRLKLLAGALGVTAGYLIGLERQPMNGLPAGAAPVGALNRIPVIGSVKAGWNGLAYEETDGYEIADVCGPEEYFFLKVTGDSMAPQISEGDLALVHKQNTADSGDLIIAVLNGEEGTIKRYVRQGAAVILQPFNPDYAPQVLAEEELEDFRIAGKVVQTLKKW